MKRIPLALLLLAAGCGTTAGARWDEVQGSDWILLRIREKPVLPGTEISLTFGTGRLYGEAVNRYGAQYERTEDALQVDRVAATKKFLDKPPGAMEQEANYLEALSTVDGWRYRGGWLDLLSKGEPILFFKLRSSESRG
jgi:heat shock protein HslJ